MERISEMDVWRGITEEGRSVADHELDGVGSTW